MNLEISISRRKKSVTTVIATEIERSAEKGKMRKPAQKKTDITEYVFF